MTIAVGQGGSRSGHYTRGLIPVAHQLARGAKSAASELVLADIAALTTTPNGTHLLATIHECQAIVFNRSDGIPDPPDE